MHKAVTTKFKIIPNVGVNSQGTSYNISASVTLGAVSPICAVTSRRLKFSLKNKTKRLCDGSDGRKHFISLLFDERAMMNKDKW